MSDARPMNAARLRARKGHTPISCVTVFDVSSAHFAHAAGIDVLLVGDSLGMTVLGHKDTVSVTLDTMIHHTQAVRRGAPDGFVVTDLPFLTAELGPTEALRSAGRCLQEGGADAVKLEGGADHAETIATLVRSGIPVVAHIGLLPQRVRAMGGYRVQGRSDEAQAGLLADAQAVVDAGACALVLEGLPASVGKHLTESVDIPTIGIGAGSHCDGQVLVWHDVLGLGHGTFQPKFVKAFADLGKQTEAALRTFRSEIEDRSFPGAEHSYED